ncbi:MAG: DUF4215 domain-containing protein, partial [Patescibacteria group bacterium]
QEYRATAYGAPDDCDVSGQALQDSKYAWSAWTATDTPNNFAASTQDVATMWLGGSIPFSQALPTWCSAACLNTGSTVKKGQSICGNTTVEKGEACDGGNATNGDGCSSSCRWEGSSQSYTPKSTCGDGVKGTGEACDDSNTTSGDGCSSKCLNEGSTAVKAVCGDNVVDYSVQKGGEDCDDGNKLNGDGCSNNCLFEGSVAQSTVLAMCGDGTKDVAHGEQCDDNNIVNGDGCSSSCLNEGTNQCAFACVGGTKVGQTCKVNADCGVGGACNTTAANCCGNGGAPGTGESCDDSNTNNGDGCSSKCLKEGSSTQYTSPLTPSFCGDGVIGTGEECDATGPYAAGGYGLATIADNAPKEVQNGYAISQIAVSAEGKVGTAKLQVQCSCKTDASCNATGTTTLGCGTGSCCFTRPQVQAPIQPSGYGLQHKGFCRNTAVSIGFNKKMDPTSFEAADKNKDGVISQAELANIRLWLYSKAGHCSVTTTKMCVNSTDCPALESCTTPVLVGGNQALCPASHQLVSANVKAPSNAIARAWQWAKQQFLSFIGLPAQAVPNFCYAPLTFKTVDISGGQRVILQYSELLEANSIYYIHVVGDNNLTDAIPKGVLSTDQVGSASANAYYFFLVGSEVCLLDSVSVEDLGKVPTKKEYEPDSFNFFSKKDEVHNFQSQALTYRAGLGAYEPIQSTNSYSWSWAWGSSVADPVPPANPIATDIVDLKPGQTPPALTDKALFTSVGNNGSEQVIATATITTDTINNPTTKGTDNGVRKGTLEVTALSCERPWPPLPGQPGSSAQIPFPYAEKSGTSPSNFGFYYCMDRGIDGDEGDLPPLSEPVDVTSVAGHCSVTKTKACVVDADCFVAGQVVAETCTTGGLFQELLFKVSNTSDAIGVRVIQNPNYLSPKAWFESQKFTAGYTDIKMDGYEGVQSGNTAYVVATNQFGGMLYPNIYVVSYNPNAGADAKEIFAQVLKNWRFNANTDVVTNVGLCQVGNAYVKDKDQNFISCQWDGDCVETFVGTECTVSKMQPTAADQCPLYKTQNAFCDSDKAKIQKDMKRLTDITTTVSAFGAYGDKNKHCSVTKGQSCTADPQCPGTEKCVRGYPSTIQGTFVPSMSVSTWDSWKSSFNDLQTTLPVDPINQYFLSCKDQGPDYDSGSCFNSKQGQFVCPSGSHVYGYQNIGGEKYTLYSQLEYTGAPWKFAIDQFPSDDVTIVAEYDGTPAKVANLINLSAGFVNNQGLCAAATVWGVSKICGDGVLGANEDCEPGQVSSVNCTDANGKAGKINVACL